MRFSGQTAVFIGIWALPRANSLDVIGASGPRWRRSRTSSRADGGAIAYDATEYIDDAIDEVEQTLAETLLIVVVVIFLFLGSLRSVLVPVVAIPVSLIGAVFLMQCSGSR